MRAGPRTVGSFEEAVVPGTTGLKAEREATGDFSAMPKSASEEREAVDAFGVREEGIFICLDDFPLRLARDGLLEVDRGSISPGLT